MSNIKGLLIDGQNLPIREFKLRWMATGPSIVMIAKKGSGKSYLCRSIIKHFDNAGIPGGMIISPTDRMNMFYGKFFPDLFIHYEYTPEKMQRLLQRQIKIIKKWKDKMRKGKFFDPRSFLIMDDCLASKGTWMKDKGITEVFYNGRHYEISYILTMQYPLGITPELRNNFDYIFLLAEDFVSNQDRIFKHYAGMFAKFDLFRAVFEDLTKDYGAMVIVNRGNRSQLLDKVFWYKADTCSVKDFGCDQFRRIHKDNYDEKWRDKEENIQVDICDMLKKHKKRGGTIGVAKI